MFELFQKLFSASEVAFDLAAIHLSHRFYMRFDYFGGDFLSHCTLVFAARGNSCYYPLVKRYKIYRKVSLSPA